MKVGNTRCCGTATLWLDARKTAALALVALVPERKLGWRPEGIAGGE
jgi:hypothetical protein